MKLVCSGVQSSKNVSDVSWSGPWKRQSNSKAIEFNRLNQTESKQTKQYTQSFPSEFHTQLVPFDVAPRRPASTYDLFSVATLQLHFPRIKNRHIYEVPCKTRKQPASLGLNQDTRHKNVAGQIHSTPPSWFCWRQSSIPFIAILYTFNSFHFLHCSTFFISGILPGILCHSSSSSSSPSSFSFLFSFQLTMFIQ